MRRACKAHSRSGKPCKGKPIIGGAVCRMHGGGAPQVLAKAQERIREYVRQMVDPDRVLQEAARLAYSDIRELYDAKGRLKPVKDWPDHLAAAIGGVDTVRRNVDGSDGHTDDVIKVKAWDKPKALEMLMKHLGLLKDRIEHSGGIAVKWEE